MAVDGTKPVEITAVDWQTVVDRLGAAPAVRTLPGGEPIRTDGGNLIADYRVSAGALDDPAEPERTLVALVGSSRSACSSAWQAKESSRAQDGVRVLKRSDELG